MVKADMVRQKANISIIANKIEKKSVFFKTTGSTKKIKKARGKKPTNQCFQVREEVLS